MERVAPGVVALVFGALFVDASPAPAASLSVRDIVVSQSRCQPHVASLAVVLSPAAQTVTVDYATADGSAVAGVDYTATSGTLTFRPGTRVRFVRVPVMDIAVPGFSKAFTLNLTNPTNATLADGKATATIRPPAFAKCDDGNACTQDSCDTATRACRHVDANACGTAVCALGSCGVDTDGDGLSDAWETNGYVDLNCNGVNDSTDLDLPGANPGQPDIYVKYDYMTKSGAGAHDHKPTAAALAQVVDAFAGHGVALHVEAPAQGIPETTVTTLDPAPATACAGTDYSTMPALRAAFFGNRQPAYHYLLFGHLTTCPDASHCGVCPVDPESGAGPDPTATGLADVGGDDVIIAAANFVGPPRIEHEASTVMHELGHNFGLKHGGNESTNGKPNYISVMNYSYQFYGIVVRNEQVGLPCAADADCGPPTIASGTCATPGACFCTGASECLGGIPCTVDADCGAPAVTSGPCTAPNACHCGSASLCYRVDYSSVVFGSLDESALNENVGISGPASSRDVVSYFVPGNPTVELLGESNGRAIDWNNSRTVESSVAVDLNDSGGAPEPLNSQNDWETSNGLFTKLDFRYQCTPAYGRAAPTAWRTNEVGLDFARQRRLRLAPKPKGPE